MSPPADIDDLSLAELRDLVLKLSGEVLAFQAQLLERDRTIAALRDEVAGLKGGPGRPDIKPNVKPSGMERATEPKSGAGDGKRRRGGVRDKLTIDEERPVTIKAPPGSRLKGSTSYIVQDLVIRAHVTNYRCQRWQTANGRLITAPLPPGIDGHFGPQLRRFVLMLYHQGQSTMARILALLRSFCIVISKRQLVRLLIADQEDFRDEAREVLRSGLAHADWITVDDTGARHKATNGFCTQIGNAHFTWFGTTPSKSRLNFLSLLRAGHDDYAVNDAALAYMRQRALAGPVITRLADHPDRVFADQAAWQAHLEKLGITALRVTPDPVTIATEGALWGSLKAHRFLNNTVIVSDDAGQFNVGDHALCWVHAERLVHKLDTFTQEQRAAQATIRGAIWAFYANLKVYRALPTPAHKAALTAAFDRIFTTKTGFVTLDRLLARLYTNKAELLRVLNRPEIPLHTNGSENDIRAHVTRRRLSGGTRSDDGRDCRDAFISLTKTCAKLKISFWNYLADRLAVEGAAFIPPLPQLLREQMRPA
jgi:Transposase IS66 family